MLLSQSIALGAKSGQRLMNSDRDTHLYSSFCTCTNVSFLMNSDRDTHLYSSFCACTNMSFLTGIQTEIHICTALSGTCTNVSFLMNSDRDTHLYSSFFTCTNMSYGCFFKFVHSKLHKIPSIYISSIKYCSF